MDVYCQHCNEPWDTWEVYNELGDENISDLDAKMDFLKGIGCPSCHWGKLGQPKDSFISAAMDAMSDILGDDVDGMASMLDDYEYMFGLDG